MNNKYDNCPNRMSYAFISNWQNKCGLINSEAKEILNKDSYAQRMYLTHNAEELMKRNAEHFYMTMNCPCVEPYDMGTILASQSVEQCNERTCTYRTEDEFGLGVRRQYWDDNQEEKAKAAFIAAKEKQQDYFKSKESCCGTASYNQDLYYPIGSDKVAPYPRTSVPSGATI